MARPAAAAALLLLLLSLLAVVAHCRPIEAQSATDDAKPNAAGDDDENGPPNPTLPAEEALHGFLRLPSHRLPRHHHRPCRHGPFFHRHHLWWARHHGAFFGDDDAPAPRRFHFRHRRHGDNDEALIHLPEAALPFPADEAANREAAGAEEEVKAVAEPDPDHRSLPDGEAFADADGAHEAAEVAAHRHEMLRRWLRFHHRRHGMRLRHHRDDEHEQEEAEDEAEGLKRFHHHHDEEEDEEKHAMRKRFRRGERDDGDDSDDEEVEEMVRRFRKAVMRRRRFGHGRRFHRHVHRHAEEEAEKADAQEEGGVVAWIKGLVNRF